MPLHQRKGTCWLNATLMCLFFSQGMRAIAMEAMRDWDQMAEAAHVADAKRALLRQVYHTARDLILRKFHMVAGTPASAGVPDEIRAFAALDPQHIAGWLNAVDPSAFKYTEEEAGEGGVGEIYVRGLLGLFGVLPGRDAMFVDCMQGKFYRSRVGLLESPTSPASPSRKLPPPSLIVVMYDVDGLRRPTRRDKVERLISDLELVEAPAPLRYVLHGTEEYVVDSLYFGNFNAASCSGHAVAGVTCGNQRYVYNGWARGATGAGALPCRLMQFDWHRLDSSFCVDVQRCQIWPVSARARKCPERMPPHRFSPGKGSRIHFAVRKDLYERGLAFDKQLVTMSASRRGSGTKAYNPAIESYMNIEHSEYAKRGRGRTATATATATVSDTSGTSNSKTRRRQPPRPRSAPPAQPKEELGFFARLCGGNTF